MDLPSAAGAHQQRLHVNGTGKQVASSHRPMGEQPTARERADAVRQTGKARNTVAPGHRGFMTLPNVISPVDCKGISDKSPPPSSADTRP